MHDERALTMLLDLPGAARAVLVPTWVLGVLPLHATRYRVDGRPRHLSDDVAVSHTPSNLCARPVRRIHRVAHRPRRHSGRSAAGPADGCETALGRTHAGEGLLGMSRALFHAGARCLVVSLWSVPDTPTRRLMRAFHRHLRHGDPPAVALAAARRQVRRSHPHTYAAPWTWAAFVLVGAGEAIFRRSGESCDDADTRSPAAYSG
ncbi:CHAT domain-containing protein [Streptomyces sp. S9]|nr:CHAT domain-containing protein [Streptomyces sp. S9]